MHKGDINSIDDLLASESFRKWILDKDEQEGLFWTQWIEENPARLEWVAAAKAIIASLTSQAAPLSQAEIDAEANAIQQKIAALDQAPVQHDPDIIEQPTHPDSRSRRPIRRLAIGIAASLLLACTGFFLYRQLTRSNTSANAYAIFQQTTKNKSVEYNNHSDAQQRIVLADGSVVVLEKDSRLHYATNFTSGKREVYLTGTAFFNIARDPSKPFIVYTQSIVTKVLGTSFTVYAPAGAATATVQVRTGKVSVFKRENFTNADANSATLKGLVLTPNQQVVFDLASEQMNRSLVEKPGIAKPTAISFDFEEVPATEVFNRLHEAYGINIVLDEEVLSSCTITASLGNEPFYEKLRIICRIINANYQVIDGNVIIDARGCHK